MVDLVLVVDDGSDDDTQHVARNAGAVVVRHSVNRGKASASETGGSVVAMRDIEGRDPRLLLFVDADLGESATSCAALVAAVEEGRTDLAIGVVPGLVDRTASARLARGAIQRATGWVAAQPLSGQRCITREAFNAAAPLSHGWGVEVGMTIDVLATGYTVQEVPCDIRKRSGPRPHSQARYRHILMAVTSRRLRGIRAPGGLVDSTRGRAPRIGEPYSVPFN